MRTRYAATALALILVAALSSACGGGGSGSAAATSDTEKIDVGGGAVVDVPAGKPLKVALFIEVGNNSAVQSTVDGAKKKAEELGAKIDVFDANLDAAKQVYQMQNALVRDYNAWVVVPVEGNQVCDIVTKQAPQQGILAANATGAACGRSSNEGRSSGRRVRSPTSAATRRPRRSRP